MLALIILAIVFLLIAIRQIGPIKLPIWAIMLGGALSSLLLGQISLAEAFGSIRLDVLLFLLAMFVIGRALEASGVLEAVGERVLGRFDSPAVLLLAFMAGSALLSAFILNDTMAIVGTPLAILIASNRKIPAKPLLIALAFSITIGSVASPIGNPQNFLIASGGGLSNPFVVFSRYLLLPSVVNLLLAFFVVQLAFGRELSFRAVRTRRTQARDGKSAIVASISFLLLVALCVLKAAAATIAPHLAISLELIALISALPILIFEKRRLEIVRTIDWSTIVFFAAMFVLMQAVWITGFIQSFETKAILTSIPLLLVFSAGASQLISNVPLVALVLPIAVSSNVGPLMLMALAAGSTIAGNLLILGAASNIIIIQNAELKGQSAFTFWEFAKIGIPLGIANLAVYWLFLSHAL